MQNKTRLIQYLELVPYDKLDTLTGTEKQIYGDYYKVPESGVTDVLSDCSTKFKYDFAKSEVILCDINGNDVFRKQIPVETFLNKTYAWLSIMKREARLIMNLDEEAQTEVSNRAYFGYIDEEGDVIDMRNADDKGNGARILSMKELVEELGTGYEVDKTGDIYISEEVLNESKLPKTSEPEEGKVYWNKKHDTAYMVVAVYPDEDDKKQVSYWNDEGTRLTCSIADFKKNMVPSKDVDDYDIFEESDDLDEGFNIIDDGVVPDLSETEGLTVDKKATNAKAFTVEINGKKYSYYPTEESGLTAKELGQKYAALAKYSVGKALAWLKKNATTKDSYIKSKEIND